MASADLEAFFRDYLNALRDHNAAIFAGAGLSIPAGMVNWQELLKDIAADVGLDVEREHDLVAVAQYHYNERGGRHGINQAILAEFAGRARLTENHQLLASLPIRTYWTTNYDSLLEQAIGASGKLVDVKRTTANLALTLPRRDVVVYKMHGDVSDPDKSVVTKDDYETYNDSRQLFSTALQGDLVSKTFLFLGFSFSDPNLGLILGRIRGLLGANQRQHYCLMRRVARADFKTDDDFQYAKAKQELQVRDLRRYRILAHLLDDYREYTDVLRELARRFYLTRAFVSGSAETYDPWSPQEAQDLARLTGRELVVAGFGVVTGFGLGIGPYVLNGAMEALESQGSHTIDDRLTLRPFPQGIADLTERARRWRAYREEMISHAGVAIFVFGNKAASGGGIELASGMLEEYELALVRRLAIVPVGCTGYVAKDLLERVLADLPAHNLPDTASIRTQLLELGERLPPSEVAARIVRLLQTLQGTS